MWRAVWTDTFGFVNLNYFAAYLVIVKNAFVVE